MAERISGELVQIDYHEDGKPYRVKSVWQEQDGVLVEFVPVVRCKDCKHMTNWKWCLVFQSGTGENGFCHFGERRDSDGTA